MEIKRLLIIKILNLNHLNHIEKSKLVYSEDKIVMHMYRY